MRILLVSLALLVACTQSAKEPRNLPILGEVDVVDGDTIYHTIPQFEFYNQDSTLISNDHFDGKIILADLFFTSCPTICPKVKQQMLRIIDAYRNEERVMLLSHSIDYRRDSVPVLRKYAEKLHIDSDRWHLVQLEKDNFEKYANEYFNVAYEDEKVPGGFDHSGRIMLVDPLGRIRGYAEGTEPESVDQLIEDIALLLEDI